MINIYNTNNTLYLQENNNTPKTISYFSILNNVVKVHFIDTWITMDIPIKDKNHIIIEWVSLMEKYTRRKTQQNKIYKKSLNKAN